MSITDDPRQPHYGQLKLHLDDIITMLHANIPTRRIRELIEAKRGEAFENAWSVDAAICAIRRQQGLVKKRPPRPDRQVIKAYVDGADVPELMMHFQLNRTQIDRILRRHQDEEARREAYLEACANAASIDEIPLELLALPTNARNALMHGETRHRTVGDVLALDEDLRRLPWFGPLAMQAWLTALEALQRDVGASCSS